MNEYFIWRCVECWLLHFHSERLSEDWVSINKLYGSCVWFALEQFAFYFWYFLNVWIFALCTGWRNSVFSFHVEKTNRCFLVFFRFERFMQISLVPFISLDFSLHEPKNSIIWTILQISDSTAETTKSLLKPLNHPVPSFPHS